MKKTNPPPDKDPTIKLAGLVRQLHETQRMIADLTVGEVDAVVHPGGHAYLLHTAQEKLRASEDEQRRLAEMQMAILNALPAHIALLDSSGVIISVNEAWRSFSSANALQSADFFVGQNYLEICERSTGNCSDEAKDSALGIRQVLLGKAKEFALEYPCHSPTERHWFRLMVTPVHAEHRAGAVVMHIDITERKLAEEQLRAKTALLEAQLNSTLDGIVVVDGDGKLVLQNHKMMELWNPPQDIFEETDHRKRMEWIVGQVVNPQEFSERVAYLYAHPNEIGRDELTLTNGKSFDRYIAPVIGRDGTYFGRIWSYRDITERKQSEKTLADLSLRTERRERMLSLALASMSDFAQIYDQTRRILFVNQPLLDLWGITLEEAVGKNFADLQYPSELAAKLDRQLQKVFETKKGLRDETPFRNPAGNEGFYEYIFSPALGPDGTVDFVVGSTRDVTERKAAERSALHLASIVEFSDDAMIGKELNSIVTSWNRGAERIFGYTAREMVGNSITRIIPEDRKNEENLILESIKRGKSVEHFETLRRTKDGRLIDISVTVSPIRDVSGTVIGASKVARDITERKMTELALKESQSRYSSLFESMLEGYAFCKIVFEDGKARDLIYLEVNKAFETLTGLKAVIGRKVSEVIPGILESNPELFEAYVRVASTGKTEQIEAHVKPLGLWFSISIYSHKKEHITAVFENVTERKRVERRMHQLVDSNVQGVIFWKRNGGITGANDAFLRLVNHTREDLENGRINWMGLTPPEYAHLDRRALEEIAATGICSPYEKEFLLKDGSRVPILLGSAAFEDNPEEGVCFFIDLTERKKLEHQFLRAQRMESIGTLAGGIAHDLNNILAPIMMSIHVLKATNEDPEAMDILETIEVSAKRGADIVRQVLSFARGVEGERLEIQPNHLVKDLQNIIKDTFPKDIRLRFDIPEDTWLILGDPTQVHQILLNLCVNARDAMPHGGNLTVGVENRVLDEHYSMMNIEAKPGRYVKISVTDSGTGMPPALIDKIFEPFFTTKDVNKGTGLGLSTVLAIVKGHEGIINVYSEQGKGTTFNVYLPVSNNAADAQITESGKISLPLGNGETILVVDDEPSIVNITKRTLKSSGYKVLTATDGADALAVYLQHRQDIAVVLTDMMMPIMDGSAFIHALRHMDPSVKIIAASGLNAKGEEAPGPNTETKYFLTKPYTAETLLKAIRAVLDEVLPANHPGLNP